MVLPKYCAGCGRRMPSSTFHQKTILCTLCIAASISPPEPKKEKEMASPKPNLGACKQLPPVGSTVEYIGYKHGLAMGTVVNIDAHVQAPAAMVAEFHCFVGDRKVEGRAIFTQFAPLGTTAARRRAETARDVCRWLITIREEYGQKTADEAEAILKAGGFVRPEDAP